MTPKVGGSHTVVLSLRPIVALRSRGDSATEVSVEDANVQQYETRVHVNVPWYERPPELMSRLADTFKVAEGLVTALTGVVVAILALFAALGIRKKRAARS